MIWYGNPCTQAIRDAMVAGLIGCIATPEQGNVTFPDEWDQIADNGCYVSEKAYAAGKRWSYQAWLSWIIEQPRSMRFAVAPDVFDPTGGPCHEPTLEQWHRYGPQLRRMGFTPAFVAQIGCTADLLPPDADVVFLGGTVEWKTKSDDAAGICERAKAEGRWLHMGKVNTRNRMVRAMELGCDSSDGTSLTRGPDTNLPLILRYLREAHATANRPTLF